ncbi:ABC-2 type transport system permease protein [Halopolyspora algeriensis]|uniref:ABC-2 type transport system permease protein n=1 Tax=Halopolyspora algeriensis TaxID=1500506 RepID=A0A368W0H5_9ACTN|nr:hypothetical protein [Halopolyspora algeriensis]RCW47132.1 ABC-2 type transport system permease protein [Halopolyspora algeriensis]TQM48219.1 ABC-2 type transport system permease protein [Halopolyspora algeriensis]
MTLLAVERIKLFSTRSPWWSMFLALGLTIGFAAMMALQSGPEFPLTLSMTQVGRQFGILVVLVMGVLTVTTEYRFGTIKATFQAVPNRTAALLAKTALIAVLALLIGETAAFGSWGVAQVVAPEADLAITTSEQWRMLVGLGPIFAGSAVLALAVGVLIRQTAGAVTLVIAWSMLVEGLVGMIPTIGEDIQNWMPFMMANHFLTGSAGDSSDMPLGPWGALAYFVAIAVGMLIIALITAHRRDA